MDIFISTKGNDDNNGTDAPVATIGRAKELAVSGDTVYIDEGRYFFDATVRFGQENDGVNYIAKGKVVFDGGIILKNQDIKTVTDKAILDRLIEDNARGSLLEIDLKPYSLGELGEYGNRGFRRPYIPAPNELFINGKPQTVAGYPKNGYIPLRNVIDSGSIPYDNDYSMRPAVFSYEDLDRAKKWAMAKDVYVSGFFKNCYADDTIKIAEINTDKRSITTTEPHLNGFVAGPETRWKVVNLLEEISIPGEYYIDRTTKKLYFYPSVDISDATLQLSKLKTPFLSFLGATHIGFTGIIFENSRGTGVYIEGGDGIHITDCTFRNLGIIAVQIGKGTTSLPGGLHTCHGDFAPECPKAQPASEVIGSWHENIYLNAAWDGEGGCNHVVEGCNIYDTGAGGILLGGGNRKKLIPANNKVYNTHISRVNRLDLTYKAAVNIWGVGNVVSHCELEDLEGFAVYLHGNDHVLEYTKIHNVIRSVQDAGAVYMGRDPSEVGNIFRYNFIYNIHNPHSYDTYGSTAIYFDDGAIYNEVYGNYFYDIVQRGPFFFSTVHWNNGGQTSVANNVFIDCYPGIDPNTYTNSNERMHEDPIFIRRITAKDDDERGVDITSEIWKTRYPYLYDTYTKNYNHTTLYYNNVVFNNQYHHFEDENHVNMKFQMKKSCYILSKYATNVVDRVRGINNERVNFEELDFHNIGLIKKENC